MDPVDYLDVQDLYLVTEAIVGPDMVADAGLLTSAAARPQASAFGEDAYPDFATQAAALMHSLVRNHALVDGNKRLGWAAVVIFCEINGRDLAPPSTDVYVRLVLSIADGSMNDISSIAGTLAGWMRPLA